MEITFVGYICVSLCTLKVRSRGVSDLVFPALEAVVKTVRVRVWWVNSWAVSSYTICGEFAVTAVNGVEEVVEETTVGVENFLVVCIISLRRLVMIYYVTENIAFAPGTKRLSEGK